MCLGMASGFKPRYEVKDVVCDYGVYEKGKLLLICNSRANALLIKDILEKDIQHNTHPQAAHRKWVKNQYSPHNHFCPVCNDDAPSFGDGTEYLSNFCPNCGAKMNEEE